MTEDEFMFYSRIIDRANMPRLTTVLGILMLLAPLAYFAWQFTR